MIAHCWERAATGHFYVETTHVDFKSSHHQSGDPSLLVGEGSIFFTGACGSLRGRAGSAAFAAAKAACGRSPNSLAREIGPEGAHVAHLVIDGRYQPHRRPEVLGCSPPFPRRAIKAAKLACFLQRPSLTLRSPCISSPAAPARRNSTCAPGSRVSNCPDLGGLAEH